MRSRCLRRRQGCRATTCGFWNRSQWMMVMSNVDLCPCRPGRVDEDTEAGKVGVLRLMRSMCVPLIIVRTYRYCANNNEYSMWFWHLHSNTVHGVIN